MIGAGAAAGLLAGVAAPARARGAGASGGPAGPARRPLAMRQDGTYDTVPLARDAIMLGVVQSRVVPVDLANLQASRLANVQHMVDLIDRANDLVSHDLLFFHEFPITGYYHGWTLDDARRVAIELPGPETELLARKAREHGCWLVFGSYVRDPAWPRALLSITTIMNDRGEIVDRHWKARNLKGFFGGRKELFTTTIYDVLDRYVEMYGPDAVIPVTRTPLGNIATSSTQKEPELFRAMAMKGAELILRTATGGFTPLDIQATSLYTGVYTALANNAASPENDRYFADTGGGGSVIYGPDGVELASARLAFETLVSQRIPIAAFRARHRQPVVHTELFLPVYEQYRSQYGPNLFGAYQPTDPLDAGRYLQDKARWPKP